jgi:hypothetical protein
MQQGRNSPCRQRRLLAFAREVKAVPRSMRFTAAKPQFRAMSVALELQGEIVPRRGVTSSRRTGGRGGQRRGMPSRSAQPGDCSSADSARSSSTKYQCSAASF